MSEANWGGDEAEIGLSDFTTAASGCGQIERRLRQLLQGDVVDFEKCDLVVIVLKKRFIFF